MIEEQRALFEVLDGIELMADADIERSLRQTIVQGRQTSKTVRNVLARLYGAVRASMDSGHDTNGCLLRALLHSLKKVCRGYTAEAYH